jgi:hypothetical protein
MDDSSHILKIYAQPCQVGEPIKPLLQWFEAILWGLSATYNTMVKAASELDDWGIKADLICFHELDDQMQEADAEERKWEAHGAVFAITHNLCKSRLEVAHASYQLGAFENLGPMRCRQPQLARQGHQSSPIVRERNNVAAE